MCISTIAAFRLAASDNIFSSPRPAVTLLTICAPASRAAVATSDFEVSIEMEILILARSFSITGTTRCNSSFTETGSAPGRVDSPPTSIMSAPSNAIFIPPAIAASGSKNSPPSENESGVTLSTPMIIPRLERSTVPSPIFQIRSRIKSQTNMTGGLFEALKGHAPSCPKYQGADRASPSMLLLRIASHQFALPDDVPAHRRVQLAALRSRYKIEHPIQGKYFEIITMCAGGRLRAAVAKIRIIIRSLDRAFRHAVLRDFRCF